MTDLSLAYHRSKPRRGLAPIPGAALALASNRSGKAGRVTAILEMMQTSTKIVPGFSPMVTAPLTK